jgi:hypothetical protein
MSDSLNRSQWGRVERTFLEARSMTFPVNNVPHSDLLYIIYVTYSYRELLNFFLVIFNEILIQGFRIYLLIHMIYFEASSSYNILRR